MHFIYVSQGWVASSTALQIAFKSWVSCRNI